MTLHLGENWLTTQCQLVKENIFPVATAMPGFQHLNEIKYVMGSSM